MEGGDAKPFEPGDVGEVRQRRGRPEARHERGKGLAITGEDRRARRLRAHVGQRHGGEELRTDELARHRKGIAERLDQ